MTDRPMTQPLPPDAFLLDLATLAVPLDPGALFEREGLLEVELGFGKGSWLWRRAERFPQRNFIGIEKTLKYVRKTRDRLVRHGVTNVRLVRTDAPHFF
ncbi:MAG: tRNA (guanine-N7)-methyltransferase, partial [bacterium]